jgi:hypothetical protein
MSDTKIYGVFADTAPRRFICECNVDSNEETSTIKGMIGDQRVSVKVAGGTMPVFLPDQWAALFRELADSLIGPATGAR